MSAFAAWAEELASCKPFQQHEILHDHATGTGIATADTLEGSQGVDGKEQQPNAVTAALDYIAAARGQC